MVSQATDYTVHALKRELAEQAIQQWNASLDLARTFLVAQEWPNAVRHYWQVYPMAERLLKNELCKDCAIKGYIRTLVELSYALRKNQQQEKLSAMLELTKPTMHTQLSPASAQELIAIMSSIAYAPIQEIDRWVEGLFAIDEAMHQPVH